MVGFGLNDLLELLLVGIQVHDVDIFQMSDYALDIVECGKNVPNYSMMVYYASVML